MATVSLTTSQPTKIATDRLVWAGALTAVLAIATNLVIYYIAESLTDLTSFSLLSPLSIIIAVGVTTLLATIIYGQLGRYSRRPTDAFRTIGNVGLWLSFLPIVGLLVASALGVGGLVVTVGTVVTLVIMNIVSASTIVGMLTTVAHYR